MRKIALVCVLLSACSLGLALAQEAPLPQSERASLIAEIDRLYIVTAKLTEENGKLREKIGILEHSAKGDASALENRKKEKRYD